MGKATILGSGGIGSTLAYSLLLRRPELDLVLVNRNERRAWAKAFDMSHCAPALGGGGIRSGGIEDSASSDLVVLTAGVLPTEDGSRADVLRDNIEVYRELVPPLAKASPGAVFIVVTNPVDAMAYAAYRLSGLPASRVLGSGTLLDGLRLRSFIGEACGIDPRKVEIEIVGEHGDSMVPLWSRASYAGAPLGPRLGELGFKLDAEAWEGLLQRTRRAGWEIRQAGEHSSYGIAFSATLIVEAVLGCAGGILTASSQRSSAAPALSVSSLHQDAYGLGEVFMSLPTRVGRGGVESVPPLSLEPAEDAALRRSAEILRGQMDMAESFIR
jgi:L-lactate dehydrogenase